MSEAMTKTIREFIYIDVPKLYSMYSQIFEGVTDQIVEQRINQLLTGETTNRRNSAVESEATEASKRTESGFLHDHMYTRLEEKLAPSLVDGNSIELPQAKGDLLVNPLVKVSGRAEIEDYSRLKQFLEEFNRMGEIVTFSNVSSDPVIAEQLENLQFAAVQANINKDQVKKLERDIEKLLNIKQNAMKGGLAQNPILMQNLKDFTEMFHSSGYDVLITPFANTTVHYRGALDKEWLRLNPQLLINLYGGQSEAPWTMVGLTTHIQGTFVSQVQDATTDATDKLSQADENNPMMLDIMRANFRRQRVFERLFLESNEETEIIVSPLAIYREFNIHV